MTSDTASADGPGTRADVATPGRRIDELDVLRGFALCGILVINIIQQLVHTRGDGGREFPLAVDLIFHERFLSIFAILFGVGFGLFLTRARERTDRPRAVLALRLAVLLVIGLAHIAINSSDVLTIYALWGLLVLIPLSFLPPRAALVVALVLLVVGPQLQAAQGVVPGLLALGYAMAVLGLPEALHRRPGRVAVALGVLGALAVAATVTMLITGPLPRVTAIDLGIGGDLLGPAVGAITGLAYCCALLLLLRTRAGPALSAVLAPMGRMALTNYLTATALFLTAGPLLGIGSLDDGAAIAALTVGILVVQALWSRWWLAWFRFGPVEWLWRCLTWRRLAPLRR